jgi:hypothetical protein
MGFSPYSASNFAVVNMSEGLAVSSSRLALALLVSKSAEVELHSRPRSVDRTRSPVAVSQKREYSKYLPETIGIFGPEVQNSESGDRLLNRKSPPLAGISRIAVG